MQPAMNRPRRHALVAIALAAAGIGVPLAASEPPPPPRVVFDGFGLEDFQGPGSIAAALRKIESEKRRTSALESQPFGMPWGVNVAGPSGREAAAAPLTAELRSRLERFDIAAGMLADATVVEDGPQRWMGRIGVSSTHDKGKESLEVRTHLGSREDARLIGIELGPRVERRLRRGTTFFVDGKAEALAVRATEGTWSLPLPGMWSDSASMVGVMARTGLMR